MWSCSARAVAATSPPFVPLRLDGDGNAEVNAFRALIGYLPRASGGLQQVSLHYVAESGSPPVWRRFSPMPCSSPWRTSGTIAVPTDWPSGDGRLLGPQEHAERHGEMPKWLVDSCLRLGSPSYRGWWPVAGPLLGFGCACLRRREGRAIRLRGACSAGDRSPTDSGACGTPVDVGRERTDSGLVVQVVGRKNGQHLRHAESAR